jgi:hypothetical protein
MGKVGVAMRIYAPECSYLARLPGVCWGGDPGARTGLLRSARDEGDSDKRAPPVYPTVPGVREGTGRGPTCRPYRPWKRTANPGAHMSTNKQMLAWVRECDRVCC